MDVRYAHKEVNGYTKYPEIENPTMRTDHSFRNRLQEEHHKDNVSPFCKLPIDMIGVFSIDYMHQSCLGVMKRLLHMWLHTKKRDMRLSTSTIAEADRRLDSIKHRTPNCFVRKPRTLQRIDRWKATEFRHFLLYSGKHVLKGLLNQELYDHFMLLNVALCILVSPTLVERHVEYAKDLLKFFVAEGKTLYGQEYLVYNTHMLMHLATDAERFGGLDQCSAFRLKTICSSSND